MFLDLSSHALRPRKQNTHRIPVSGKYILREPCKLSKFHFDGIARPKHTSAKSLVLGMCPCSLYCVGVGSCDRVNEMTAFK